MKNIKLLIVILIVAFSAFNISMSITENSENNITLNSIMNMHLQVVKMNVRMQ